MNRRKAIRNITIIATGAILVPACKQDEKSTIPLKYISLTSTQEKMLAALSEAILPTTNSFIGASALKAHEFVLLMVDDCAKPEDQNTFMKGMKLFEENCKSKWNTNFVACTLTQKEALLITIEKKEGMPEDVVKFYETVKRYTIQSFTSSKKYLTDIKQYKMVPGPIYNGCVAVTPA